MNEFDLIHCPMEGTHAIVASAGTGKTYTITYLVIRLIIEKQIPIDKMLVVTFTKAATQELNQRIRGLLDDARHYLLTTEECADDNLKNLLNNAAQKTSVDTVLMTIEAAIQSFHEASITTIHGFCQSILKDFSFEASLRSDSTLVTSPHVLLHTATVAFWRTHIVNQSSLFLSFASDEHYTFDYFFNLAQRSWFLHDAKPIPELSWTDSEPIEKQFQDTCYILKKMWEEQGDHIQTLFLTCDTLNKTSYSDTIRRDLLKTLSLTLPSLPLMPGLWKNFEKLTTNNLRTKTNKGKTPLAHPFFDCCEKLFSLSHHLITTYKHNCIYLKVLFITFIRSHIETQKKTSVIHTFDDLLILVYKALKSPMGKDLCIALQKRFQAALIDEFQDTDPIQYGIFSFLFAHKATPFFLIGDPKQAIYSFRGADIFTFISALRTIPDDHKHTLQINRRSTYSLISALNILFGKQNFPFVFKHIPYQKLIPAKPFNENTELYLNGSRVKPFRMWFLTKPSGDSTTTSTHNPLSIDSALSMSARMTVTSIQHLLAEGVFIEANGMEKKVQPSDIAILFRKNYESDYFIQALSAHHIPFIVYHDKSLFQSTEALELFHLLSAVNEPSKAPLIRRALCTPFFGFDAQSIYATVTDDLYAEKVFQSFSLYKQCFLQKGIAVLLNTIFAEYDSKSRLLSLPQGQRRLTNVMHLLEILEKERASTGASLTELITWLCQVMNPEDSHVSCDEQQLRLETDENAVKLLTIHRSKGLQFPIVFCPSASHGTSIDRDAFVFHQDHPDSARFLDLGGLDQDTKTQAELEQLSENLRLLYVALTRSQYLCVVTWGAIGSRHSLSSSGFDTSALAYCILNPIVETTLPNLETLSQHCLKLHPQEVFHAVYELFASSSSDAVVQLVSDLGDLSQYSLKDTQVTKNQDIVLNQPHKAQPEYTLRESDLALVPSYRTISFSSIAKNQQYTLEEPEPDVDEDDEEPIPLPDQKRMTPGDSFIYFPTGSQAGICIHSLLEHYDFSDSENTKIQEFIAQTLRIHGFNPAWQGALETLVKTISGLKLSSPNHVFTLSSIPLKQTIRECEFYYKLKPGISEKISQLLATLFDEKPGRSYSGTTVQKQTNFRENDHMHGFIDCIVEINGYYYIIDWKTNFLGYEYHFYEPSNLTQYVRRNLYHFQYYIYTLACDLFCKNRDPFYEYDSHFGGIFYIFLRGLNPLQGTNGIFYDRPPKAAIESLKSKLLDESTSHNSIKC